MNTELVEFQISLSTAEEEANYFSEEISPRDTGGDGQILCPGSYRVIDGQLYRIRTGVPPVFGVPSAR
jgi:hypothetical protein